MGEVTTDQGLKRRILRVKDGRWCELEVELRDGRLSICGSEGRVISRGAARREARESWESFFEEDRNQLHEMNDRMGTNYRTAKGAAKFVVETDGEFHGLDVHRESGAWVFVTESCGQIREDLLTWFPEVAPYLKWHLNDMHAECEHQEARGETWATHPSAECPDCGYVLGSAWKRRELPAEVIAWAQSLNQPTTV